MKDGKINMLVWNINQRAGVSKGESFYPKTVREYLHKKYDIIIFMNFINIQNGRIYLKTLSMNIRLQIMEKEKMKSLLLMIKSYFP